MSYAAIDEAFAWAKKQNVSLREAIRQNREEAMAKKHEDYTLTQDDDGHEYVIPYSKLADWHIFLQDEDAVSKDEVPEWATRFGGTLVFTDWKIV